MNAPPQRLSKSNFMQYLHCPKSLWIERHKPHVLPPTKRDATQELLRDQGYILEAAIENWLASQPVSANFKTQVVFETARGAYARCDGAWVYPDGSLDLIEIKSAHSVQSHHRNDLAFQACVAEACGHRLQRLLVAHPNGDYTIGSSEAEFILSEETTAIRDLMPDIAAQIPLALEFLSQATIDETNCTCLALTRTNHCTSFDYLNASLPDYPIYMLPNIRGAQLNDLREDGFLAIKDVPEDRLSPAQKRVAWSARNQAPFIDLDYIKFFWAKLTYPLYFYDYEAFKSARPDLEGVKAGTQIPFQFSLHILDDTGALRHVEFLAEQWEKPAALIEALRANIGPQGSVISWNKGYENGRNSAMAELYPHYATFLDDLSKRTVDLMDVFKHAYVDIRFQGRTSIKNVLPVLVPELSYESLAVANGGAAMQAFSQMISMPASAEREQLRREMLEYCALDSFAMVRLYQEIDQLLK